MSDRLTILRHYINYYLPREVLGPVALIFSLENVIDILFQTYMPESARLVGWIIIAILAGFLVREWGEADEDREDLKEDIEEILERE